VEADRQREHRENAINERLHAMAGNMTDLQFVQAFESCALPNENFRHRDHIRLAWIYLQLYGGQEARRHMSEAIRRFAAFHGKTDKYHETITLAWLRLVAHALTRLPRGADFDALTKDSPELLEKRTIERFYSADLLASEAARTSWVEPDLQSLP